MLLAGVGWRTSAASPWRFQAAQAGTRQLVRVAWDGTAFVAVADDGATFHSADGLTWTQGTAAPAEPAPVRAADGNTAVALSAHGTLLSRSGSGSWRPVAVRDAQGSAWRAVAEGRGRFVAVGESGAAAVSRDGWTWQAMRVGLAWGGAQGQERFVAVGRDGAVAVSRDGRSWSASQATAGVDLKAVVWCAGRFLAAGAGGTILSSPDGERWTEEASPVGQWLNGIASNGTRAVAVGDIGTVVEATTLLVVTSVSPNAGPTAGGTAVTITGSGFTGATAVYFGGIPATNLSVKSDTQITCTSPAVTTAGTVHVTVTTPSGTSATTTADQFTYYGPPTLTAISPNAGLTAGGTTVVITGTNFAIAGLTSVKFGAVASPNVTVAAGGLTLTAVSPAQAAGVVDITVTTPGGTTAVSPADKFTYVAPVPVVLSLAPASGPMAGGTTVTLSGLGFTGATKVLFGAVAGTKVSVTNDTTLTVVSPASKTAGAVDVTVTTAGGTSPVWTGDEFTYQTPAPMVTSIAPSSGPVGGGTMVTITGSNFTGSTSVAFGTNAASSVTVMSATQIKAVSPPGSGSVHVTVTTSAGTSTTSAADVFTYVAPPTVTGITPRFGSIAGGTSVIINGTGFQAGASVTIGGVPAGNVSVSNATTLSAVTGAHASPGAVDVVVTNPDAQAGTLTGGFTYALPPTITAVAKLSDPLRLKITGSNFSANSSVSINGQLVPEASWKDSAKIIAKGGGALKAMLPKGVPVQITVTNNDTLITSQPFLFAR
jgi:hypothetical protein